VYLEKLLRPERLVRVRVIIRALDRQQFRTLLSVHHEQKLVHYILSYQTAKRSQAGAEAKPSRLRRNLRILETVHHKYYSCPPAKPHSNRRSAAESAAHKLGINNIVSSLLRMKLRIPIRWPQIRISQLNGTTKLVNGTHVCAKRL
jgi:hypothetical protein